LKREVAKSKEIKAGMTPNNINIKIVKYLACYRKVISI
jgi:hypothetical protein